MKKEPRRAFQWLLIFYTVPSRPVRNRIRLWRQLANAGAIQLKGAVCILPYSEAHYEFLQWIVSEVTSMGGEGSFVKVSAIETMTDQEIIGLFNSQRGAECRKIDNALDEFERKLSSLRKGTKALSRKPLGEDVAKHRRDYEAVKKRDFFGAPACITVGTRLDALESILRDTLGLAEGGEAAPSAEEVRPRRREEFQAKTWLTRKRPFVDRMASAWLVKRFVDEEARFRFVEERDIGTLGREEVSFDVRGGTFTHVGDLCTFEVLQRAFSLKDKALKRIAEIVHQLDLKDERYNAPEARGIEEILLGICKTAENDRDALERGMAVFEMLYASKK